MPEHVLDHTSASTVAPTDPHASIHASAVVSGLRYLWDCFIILTAIPLLLPMVAAFAICIKASSPGPMLLRLRTLGKDGKVFYQYRFRTIKCTAPQAVWGRDVTMQDKQITSIGRFLLKTGLNVMPQLVNVLRGDMVLIGPPALALAHVGTLKGASHRLRSKPGVVNR